MEAFNLSKINIYSIDELVEFILSGSTTKEQLYNNGLFRPNRPLLEKALNIREVEDWCYAREVGTVGSLSSYINLYDKNEPYYRGRFVEEAKNLLDGLATEDDSVEIENSAINIDQIDINNDNKVELSSLLSSLIYNSNKRELGFSDNDSWLKAAAENTIDSYEDYLSKYQDNPWGYIGGHVEEAKNKILEIKLSETNATVKTGGGAKDLTPFSFNNPLSYMDLIKRYGLSICAVVAIIGGLICFLWWSQRPKKLSEDEIKSILVHYTDSLKQDLFDGFYLAPISKADILIVSGILEDSIPSSEESPESGLYSYEEVVRKYMLDNGKFVVKNKDDVTINLPEATYGIDSICVKDSPFIEYIDNNGLRRVVALYNGGMYYYTGECGSVDNIRQFILVNQEGKYGILNINKKENKRFENDKIEQIASSQRYYVVEP